MLVRCGACDGSRVSTESEITGVEDFAQSGNMEEAARTARSVVSSVLVTWMLDAVVCPEDLVWPGASDSVWVSI